MVIATVLATASLVLITVHPRQAYGLTSNDIMEIGLAFAIVGLSYRQSTAWSRKSLDEYKDREQKELTSPSAYIREFLLLVFLSIPIAFWVYSLTGFKTYTAHITIVIAVVIALCLTKKEMQYRKRYGKVKGS